MVNEQLLTYIRNQLQKGIAPAEIKSALLARGWVLADVEAGFQEAAKPEVVVDKPSPLPADTAPLELTVALAASPSSAGGQAAPTGGQAKSDLAAAEPEPALAKPEEASLSGAADKKVLSPLPTTPAAPIITPRSVPLKRQLILSGVLCVVFLLALVLAWSLFRLRQGTNETTPTPAPTPPLYQPLTTPPLPEATPSGSQATPSAAGTLSVPNVPLSLTPPPPPPPTGGLANDTDNDGLSNEREVCYGTDSLVADTDKDGWFDGEEVQNGYNPLGSGKMPEDLKTKCP